ncbi:MAG: phosphotransferase [Caldilineaceae bacterium]
MWPLPSQHAPVLLHGDFWPGNVLWQDGRLTGVIDWEGASAWGSLADVANAHLELLWAWGPAAMAAFTVDYLAAAPVDAAPALLGSVRSAATCGQAVVVGIGRRNRTHHA